MPRFLKSQSAELNDTLAPKKRVIKNLKRTFKGSEQSVSQANDVSSIFTEVYTKMVGIIASMTEISNQLTLSAHTPSGTASRAVDRYVGATSAVLQQVKLLLLYLDRNVPSMNIFATNQIEALNGLNSQLVGLYQTIDESSKALQLASQNAFRRVLGVFGQDLMILQQRLEGLQAPQRGRTTFQPFKEPAVKPPKEVAAERRAAIKAAKEAEVEGTSADAAGAEPKPKPRGRPKKKLVIVDDEMVGEGYGGGAFKIPMRPLIGSNPNTWTPAMYRTKVDVGLPMGGYTPTRFL